MIYKYVKCAVFVMIALFQINVYPLDASNKHVFKADNANWFDYKNDSGLYDKKIIGNEIHFTVTNPGNYPWSNAFGQSGISLEKGYAYRVEFKVRSSEKMRSIVLVAMSAAPYYSYSGVRKLRTSETAKNVSFDFTMRNSTDENAVIQFQCGARGTGTLIVSNLKITLIGKEKDLVVPKNFPAPFASSMKRGINLGNTLDAPNEGNWGPELKEEYFATIKKKGVFDHIRIPCRWETHAGNEAPYAIDPAWMKRVDWAVSHALKNGFFVVLNMHHNTEFEKNPMKQKDKFLAMWGQIAEHFKTYPSNLYFEIYNEPGTHQSTKQGTLEDASVWNELWPQAYDVIRKSNTSRTIIISGPVWASPDAMTSLVLPDRIAKDKNIIAQVHFYYPADFCMQGTAGNDFDDVSGIRWRGSDNEIDAITTRFDRIDAWRKPMNLRLWNGEFGCFDVKSVPEDRMKWINFITSECERRAIPWAYWDFAGDASSLYDLIEGTWDDDVIKALTVH
jgi:endoglucanase